MKVLHFADAHLGMENHGRLNSVTGLHSRYEDGLKCLEHVVQTAVAMEVDAVLFAGDAYRTCEPTPTHQHGFATQFRMLREAGIPVVMVPGNHDMPVAFGRKSSLAIFDTLGHENFHLLTSHHVAIINTVSGPLQIAPVPWPQRSQLLDSDQARGCSEAEVLEAMEASCLRRIDEMAAAVDPALPSVLLAHLMVTSARVSGSEYYAAINRDPRLHLQVVADPRFDYVALGHVHRHQDLNSGSQPPVVYPGSLDRINFGEEKDTKGFCVATIHSRGNCSVEFVTTPCRRFLTLHCRAIENEDATASIVREANRYSAQIPDAIVRVVYEPAGDDSEVDMREVRSKLSEAWMLDSVTRVPHKHSRRARRSEMHEALAWPEALSVYAESRPEILPYLEEIRACAARLEGEIREQGRPD